MGAENLGYLAQLLGGMQQGKLLKQKKELSAAQVAARKADAEQKALDRQATSLYRGQQLDLGRQNLELSKQRLKSEAGKGLQTFIDTGVDTRKAIINAANNYDTRLRAAKDPKTYRAIRAEAIKDLSAQTKILDDLSQREDVAGYFGGADKAQGVFRAGIPSFVFDPNFGTYEPDWNTLYKPDRTGIDKSRSEGFLSGNKNVGFYIQNELPQYQRIVEDLGGDPIAAQKAVQMLGPIRGTSAQETVDLINGKVSPMFLSNKQYRNQFDPMAAMGREYIPVYDETTGDLSGYVDEFGQSFNDVPEFDPNSVSLPDPGNQIQRTSAYTQDIPVALAATRQDALLPLQQELLRDKVVYNKYTLDDRINKGALANLLSQQKLDKGDLDIVGQRLSNATAQLKLDNLPEEMAAKLDQIYAQTFRTKVGAKVDGVKAYEAIKKVFDADYNFKQKNLNELTRTVMLSPAYLEYISGDTARQAKLNAYLANPDKVPMPSDVNAPLQLALSEIVKLKTQRDDAQRNQTSVMSGAKAFVTNFNELGSMVQLGKYRGVNEIKKAKPGASGKSGGTRQITGGASQPRAGSNTPPFGPPKLSK